MGPAPVVQDLNSLVAKYQAALKPQADALDASINDNTQSGTAQTAGIDAKQTAAFGSIATQANAHGQDFTGFTPDAEAKYTGATYLPALATLQNTIDATKNTLLGKKADLAASANTSALGEQSQEQKDLQTYQQQQAAAAAAAAAETQKENAAAQQAALDRQNALAIAGVNNSSKTPKAVTGYGLAKNAIGGLAFHGPNGQPVSAGAYLDAISGGQAGTKDLAALLSTSGTSDDQKIAKSIGNMSTAAAQKAYPWLFQ